MAWSAHSGLVLACYDGSSGSRQALHSAGVILGPRRVIVLTVWQPVSVQLSWAGVFGAVGGFDGEGAVDERELAAAHKAADDGVGWATEQGFDATARVEQTNEPVWQAIVDIANELDVSLVVCGSRGRGPLSGLLGHTSTGVLHHAHRPVLMSPERPPLDRGPEK